MNAREIKQAKLEKQIEGVTANLREQLEEYKEKGGGLLVIAGIIVGAYLLYRLLSSSDDEEQITAPKKVHSEVQNQGYMKNAVMGLLGSVAVGLARETLLKMVEKYLINDSEREEKSGDTA